MDMKVLSMLMAVILFGVSLEVYYPIDAKKIRFGNISDFSEERQDKVGVVNSPSVYEHIPEYKIILKQKIKRGTARYTQLMIICTEKFKKAVKSVALANDYKIVVEIGGVSDYPSTDVTDLVIDKIK